MILHNYKGQYLTLDDSILLAVWQFNIDQTTLLCIEIKGYNGKEGDFMGENLGTVPWSFYRHCRRFTNIIAWADALESHDFFSCQVFEIRPELNCKTEWSETKPTK